MNKSWINLFSEITRSVEVMAERVMEMDRDNKDDKGEQTAQLMRDDFATLHDKLNQDNFDPSTITRNEWCKILTGAMIIVQNIEDQIAGQKKAVQNYKINLLPKLNRIVDETKTDEEARNLANELFESK